MALTLADHAVRPLTADEVERMVQEGIIGEDEPVELLQGALVEMSPKGEQHATVMARLVGWLAPLAVAGTHELRTEHPLAVPDPTSLPEPDIAVIEARADPTRRPTSALLVVEVSVSSRAIDTTIKPRLYASAGVPDYWVVDVAARRIEIRRDPAGSEYRTLDTGEGDQTVEALCLDLRPLNAAALLSGI